MAAALEVLENAGYQSLSIADVAKRAGVHETSIYRRWPTKGALVAAAINRNAADELPATDDGSLDSDVVSLLRRVVARLETSLGKAIGQIVASQEPELEELRQADWKSRLQSLRGSWRVRSSVENSTTRLVRALHSKCSWG